MSHAQLLKGRIFKRVSVDNIACILSGALCSWAFLPAADDSPATSIHRCFHREIVRRGRLRDRLRMCAGLPLAPIMTLALVAFFTARNGKSIKKQTGTGIARQVWQQITLAARFAILPPWYYIFELHDDAKRTKPYAFLNRWEMKYGLYPLMREYNGGLPLPAERSTSWISNKDRFAARCRDLGITTPPVLMIVTKRGITPVDWNEPGLPEVDLFIKPTHGAGGTNASRWEYQGSGTFRSNRGELATAPELLEILQRAAHRGDLLVLPRLVSHPAIADLANGVLATVRMMSCRNERGEPEVTNAAFRMAKSDDVVVDNFHAGGIAAAVDLATGELGRATGGGWGVTAGGWFERHPGSGAQILGRRLPCWREMVAFVERTHRTAFADQVVLGWDVALLSDGPCLIEVNKGPDLDIIQRVGQRPVGNERLGKLLALNLQRSVAAKHSQSPATMSSETIPADHPGPVRPA